MLDFVYILNGLIVFVVGSAIVAIVGYVIRRLSHRNGLGRGFKPEVNKKLAKFMLFTFIISIVYLFFSVGIGIFNDSVDIFLLALVVGAIAGFVSMAIVDIFNKWCNAVIGGVLGCFAGIGFGIWAAIYVDGTISEYSELSIIASTIATVIGVVIGSFVYLKFIFFRR